MTEKLIEGYVMLVDSEGNYVDIKHITASGSYMFTGLKPNKEYKVEWQYYTEEIDYD